MPGRRPVLRKHVRAPETPARRLRRVADLAYAMEEPLADSANFVRALGLIGHSLVADRDDAGEPIVTVAWAASKRLEDLKKTWEKLLCAHRRRA